MRIWEWKRLPKKETEEELARRERYNRRKHKKNRLGVPLEKRAKRFAKNRTKFCITLNDGSEWQIEDTSHTDPDEKKGGLKISLIESYRRPSRMRQSRGYTDNEDEHDMFVDVGGGGWDGILLVARIKGKAKSWWDKQREDRVEL